MAAVALALVVRGRWLAVDILGAGACAAGLIAAHLALGDALAADVALDQARGGMAGGIAAALVVVVAFHWANRDGRALANPGVMAPRVTTA